MSADNVVKLGEKRISVMATGTPLRLVDTILGDLVKAGLIEEFEIYYDFELSPISSEERVLGEVTDDEKRTFAAYTILSEMLEDFMREKEADLLVNLGKTLRDKSIQSQNLAEHINGMNFAPEDRLWVAQVMHSIRLLADVWSYSIKSRYNVWDKMVGIRQTFVAVAH